MPTIRPLADERATLTQVVDELLHTYTNVTDWPADHRCTKAGRHTCHHRGVDAPLVERLAELVERGTGLASPGGVKSHPARQGSPAPWAAAPAELLMEIWHRSVDFADELRDELDFRGLKVPLLVMPIRVGGVQGPIKPVTVWVPAAAAGDDGGRVALLEIPRLVAAADSGSESAALVAGWVEQQVRGWHRRALLITGHEVSWTRLDQIPNPNHLASYDVCGLDGGGFLVGPFCVACRHRSCAWLRDGRKHRWVEPLCPYCGRSMLRRNPVTAAVHCLSPTCVDDRGRHHVWSLAQWTRP